MIGHRIAGDAENPGLWRGFPTVSLFELLEQAQKSLSCQVFSQGRITKLEIQVAVDRGMKAVVQLAQRRRFKLLGPAQQFLFFHVGSDKLGILNIKSEKTVKRILKKELRVLS